MSEQLFVNGVEVDLEAQNISRSIRVADIAEITTKRSSISAGFKLRRTAKNNKALGMLGTMGNTAREPYQELRATYIIDTSPVVVNGLLKIERSDAEFFHVRLYDGLIDLSARLQGKLLADLPLSDLDHYLNVSTFTSSWANTEGYIYAFGDYGQGTGKVEYIAPSFYVHTLFDKIFNDAGITYESDFFSSDVNFRKEVITPSIGYTPEDIALTITDKGDAASDTVTRDETSGVFFSRTDIHEFTNIDLVDMTITSGDIISGVSGRIEITIDTSWTNNCGDLECRVKLNGGVKAHIELETGSFLSKQTKVTLLVSAGDTISMDVLGVSQFNGTDLALDYDVQNDIHIDEITGGMQITASEIIGKMTQIDFVRDVLARHGLFLTPIAGNNESFRIKRLEDVLSDTATAVDWSSKLVELGEEEYVSGLAQSNRFKYKYTKDIVDFAQDGSLDVDNYNADLESDYYSSPFEIPIQTRTLLGRPVYNRTIFELNSESLIEGKEVPNSVLSVEKVNSSITLFYFDDAGVGYTGDIAFLSLDDIGMQDLIDANYPKYKAVLNDFRSRTCLMNLSPTDIYNVRFDRLYYLKQTGRYFYLNSIQYRGGDLAKVVLTQVQ